MEEEQQQPLHRGILDGIARLEDPEHEEERHKLIVDGSDKPLVDRRSLQHLVDFLDNGNDDDDDGSSHEVVVVMELELKLFFLPHPSDGGLEVLQSFFARSDTGLTKVSLRSCDFGSQQDASRLLAAFETNRTVIYLTIRAINNLEGTALGNSLSGLMQNMPQLQRLECSSGRLGMEGVRAFQPSLQVNRTLKALNVSWCYIGDEGICLIAGALVGNTTIEILDIGRNGITSIGLADITRILEVTQLKTINWEGNNGVFDDMDATHHFVTTLQHKKSSVQELPGIIPRSFPMDIYAIIKNSLAHNEQLNHVNLLLAPPLPQQQPPRNAGTMMLKISHKAITKFAQVPNNSGASAIFKLFQARPALLEKRLKRPPAATTAADAAAAVSQEQKHPRCL